MRYYTIHIHTHGPTFMTCVLNACNEQHHRHIFFPPFALILGIHGYLRSERFLHVNGVFDHGVAVLRIRDGVLLLSQKKIMNKRKGLSVCMVRHP